MTDVKEKQIMNAKQKKNQTADLRGSPIWLRPRTEKENILLCEE